MPEFYIIIAGKIFSPNFRGHVPTPLPPSPTLMAPRYLSDDIRRIADSNRRRLRSSSSTLLTVRPTRLVTMGNRAFPVAGSRLWNSLPHEVTSASTLRHSLSSVVVLRHTFSSFHFLPTRLHLYSGLAVCE